MVTAEFSVLSYCYLLISEDILTKMTKAGQKLRIDITQDETEVSVKLIGIIDEDADFQMLKNTKGPMVVNFEEVSFINSSGAREWINLVTSFAGRNIFYKSCPPVIVNQMNMVASFRRGINVLSVLTPFVCDGCEIETLVLVNAPQFAKVGADFPSPICHSCKKKMVAGISPIQYFSFGAR